jgi:hypothetical protein
MLNYFYYYSFLLLVKVLLLFLIPKTPFGGCHGRGITKEYCSNIMLTLILVALLIGTTGVRTD